MTYQPPVRDHAFILRDVLNIDQHGDLPGFADAPFETVEQILEAAAQFTGEVLAPLNGVGDKPAASLEPGLHGHHAGRLQGRLQAAVRRRLDGPGLGPGLWRPGPAHVVNLAFSEMSSSANMAFSMYPGLAHGRLFRHPCRRQRRAEAAYLPKMVAGEWTGTMNLTEPHCGTDLGLIKTKAVPQGDGSYAISGTEDLHLGRRAGHHRQHRPSRAGPHRGRAGRREGHLALRRARNASAPTARSARTTKGVSCGSIEHKMGIHGNSTCVMNYDGARAGSSATENKGLNAMFVMMNEARLGVAIQGWPSPRSPIRTPSPTRRTVCRAAR
jgi:alkylation response protein AidB-like acyl-CoA dehydrogenase